jgi:hypothetical protein
MKTIIVHTYVHDLIDNTDGKFDSFGSAWFKVPENWLESTVAQNGFVSLKEFNSTYTYDDSEGLLKMAIDDGVLLGCGAGDMTD